MSERQNERRVRAAECGHRCNPWTIEARAATADQLRGQMIMADR
jgi:hypothetical protein